MTKERGDSTASGDEPAGKGAWYEHRPLRQFVKFCIVGGSSMAVNFGTLWLMHQVFHVTKDIVSLSLAFVVSVCNGFIWNRLWTFKEARHQAAHGQYLRFFLVNIVGFILNTTIAVLVIASSTIGLSDTHALMTIAGQIVLGTAKHSHPLIVLFKAQFVATLFVVFWNFFANRLWTFKH